MEEVTQVTTKTKSKKVVTILLIITGILGLALLGVAIYFYTIGDTSKDNTTTEKTCACYFIDPAVVSECGDPRRAFILNTKTVPSDQTCSASCSTSELSSNLLNSTTEQDLYQVCQVQTIEDTRCTSMKITDGDGKIVTGKVSSSDEINIEATFDSEYTNYQFIINNENQDPDVISPDKLTIKKTISDLSSLSTLNIVATATDSTEQINSTICRRLIDINQTGEASVNDVQITTTVVDSTTKASDIKIGVGNLASSENIKVVFSFDNQYPNLTMTQGFTTDLTKGQLEMIQQELYDSSNFSNSQSFSQLDTHTGELEITATVYISDSSIGSASDTISFTEEDTNTGTNTDQESEFAVTKTSDVECIERVEPNNTATFTITVTNEGATSQSILSIKDKLPLGMDYTAGTTKINDTSVSDSSYVTATNVGDSQEVVFAKSDGWTLTAGQTLTITLETTAGSDALTGENMNEVIVTPEQIPADPSTLSAEYNIYIAQDCSDPDARPDNTPDTGIFDSIIFKTLLGIIIISLGWYIYSKPQGNTFAYKIASSKAYKDVELQTWRVFKPKKYFEETVVMKSKENPKQTPKQNR